eukprot:CAMPEP_0205935594 /NCGR_PEP_ID=MMETSP1325-20131115/39484_1 /ASSEMBLY_ACC=CAM_ASM_000708 /TAXON_ID=236786 /ORGANISM="Florenciella sp., Strain RCC1007" /LENGTH=118 /DNA_ID=CAMNT_0053305695 /DNA_START=86 /DNA_END=439 /DNA_ORIENTATION=+
MPWLSIPYSSDLRAKLQTAMEVKGYPTFVVLDEERNVITKAGRDAVHADPMGDEFPWYPKLIKDLKATTDGLLESRAVVLLADAANAPTKDALLASLTTAAEALTKEQGSGLNFYVSK